MQGLCLDYFIPPYNKRVQYLRKNWGEVLLGILVISNLLVWIFVFSLKPRDYVKVSFLDVGQGDSILIESTNRNQILIDGGGDKRVLGKLSNTLPFFDKHIDVVIETHPDKDHIGGLPEVIERYQVGAFFEPGVESDNGVDDELKRRVTEKSIPSFLARKGMMVDMGDGSYLEILFPDRDVSGMETNDASMVAKYVYGDTCFLLTGDSPSKIEEYLIGQYKESLECEVLKAGHHGSRTSTSKEYLHFVKPEYAIVSAGKDNSYGHPHQEVVENLEAVSAKILKTFDEGTTQMVSNGKKVWQK